MSMGMLYTCCTYKQWVQLVVIHNCVGFCVARSDDVGNAKASSCGMGDT